MYSLRTSFWIVPESLAGGMPCSSATSWYSSKRTAAGALMVIDVETWSRGMPAKSSRMSSIESMATPTLPTSPGRDWRIGVVAHLGRQVKGNRKTRSPVCDQLAIAGIGLRGGAEARVLAHGPRPGGVHRRVDAPRVGIVAGLTERKIRIEFGEILRPVDGLEWRSRLRLCTHLGIGSRYRPAAARASRVSYARSAREDRARKPLPSSLADEKRVRRSSGQGARSWALD